MEIPEEYKRNIYRSVLALLVVLTLFFAMKFVSEVKSYNSMGSGEVNVITLSGHGEVSAVPDIATVYFTIRKEAKTVKEAQEGVAVVEKGVLDFLKQNKVEQKDIKTTNASFNPKYEYQYGRSVMPCSQFDCPPNPGKSVITGYEAYESITVKVRNTDDVGTIMQGLGTLGVSDLSGPNFSIDDEDALRAEARREAIEEARKKAKVLADDLGVRLGRVVTFTEGGGYPVPFYGKAMMEADGVRAAAPAPAEIPKGENTITSDVTITYEIR